MARNTVLKVEGLGLGKRHLFLRKQGLAESKLKFLLVVNNLSVSSFFPNKALASLTLSSCTPNLIIEFISGYGVLCECEREAKRR